MAYGYRRRYSYRRYRPRRYVRRWFRRRMRRFVNGSSKSTVRVKIPLTQTFSLASVNSAGKVYTDPISPWFPQGAFRVTQSPLYRIYCDLYDEVKCIGCKVVLSIGTPIGTSTVPSATFVTAWDRRLGNSQSDPGIDAAPTFSELMSYSSQQKATAVNNSIAKLRRSCYASDLMEKAQWHDCSLSSVNQDDVAVVAAGANPNFFSPGMWIGVSQTGSAAQTISMQADIVYYFAFRNPKYGASGSYKGVETRSLPAMADMEHEDLADDGDMDADDLVDDILDMGANMSKNAAEGAAQRRAILKARRQQAKDRVPVTKTI